MLMKFIRQLANSRTLNDDNDDGFDYDVTVTNIMMKISQLPNLFIGSPRVCNFILLLIVLVRSFSKMLSSVKFTEVRCLFFAILRENF